MLILDSSTITTAPIFKPLDGLTTVKDEEITTSTASTAFPTIITTASLLPQRLVRAAEDGWELEGQSEKVALTNAPAQADEMKPSGKFHTAAELCILKLLPMMGAAEL